MSEQPEFELDGQCFVFPWGISWTPSPLRGPWRSEASQTARWGEITSVEEWFRPKPVSDYIVTASLVSEHYCEVYLKDRPIATFEQEYLFRLPAAWTNFKPVPGSTKQVNVRQFARIIANRAGVPLRNLGRAALWGQPERKR